MGNYIKNKVTMSGRNNRVNVNGVEIDIPNGSSVSIQNGTVYIDGKKYENEELKDKQVVNLIVNGNPQNVSATNVEVNGTVKQSIDASGNVTVYGDMEASIDAMGNVTINGKHTGKIDAMGNVTAG
ncbi:hypothetical protein [Metaclostridioides mangenotii]|uniref:hypothetical protein n=1 Tax=Metaclostridioides mangenotii TaxID=1540 RepID=UPI00046623F8|nr:hypothetical protein [Clostridioides mangenotii]